ncbi:zinc finger protein 841-like isoform X2 [Oncorhynchus tshawytscha]|uniref:C2H2-type domain-containing protein n=1 Tax=Oncorhynchus tshawytscha TaxID=74940 RepID=A0A8C8JM05_ONCTS|nr:zinc finger protein 841-like isoform X2 [Oncorhynchus tshawytscha]
MERHIRGVKGPSLPLPSLRLMIPPMRLVSAAIWQTIQQRHVMDYGMLEEFVTMVTEIVPELLNDSQRAQLILGLRARLVLELCRSKPITDLQTIQPHLDRIQTLTPFWRTQADAEVGLSESNFLGLVQTLLKDPGEREHFFQDVFPVEFGPSYDVGIQKLMWQFLSRLEKLLPVSNFQQAALLLSDVPSVLEECVESISHPQQLKTLLQYHRDLCQLDNHDPPSSTDGDCILSALCLPPVERVVITTEVKKEGTRMDVKEREGVDSRSGECEKNKTSSVSDDEEVEDDAGFADPETDKVEPEYETVMGIGEDGIEKPFKLIKTQEETHYEKFRKKPKPEQKRNMGMSKEIRFSMIQKPSVDLQGIVIANMTQTPKSNQQVPRAKRSLERRTCKLCGKVVQRPAVLRKHMLTHTGDWPYQCPTCKKIYKALGSFQEHTERCVFPIEETPEDNESSISVMQYKGLMLKKILPRPQGQKAGPNEKNLKRIVCKTCPVCGKTFATGSSMKRHQIIHTEPKKCRVCKHIFPNSSELKIHMESHPKKGIHQCSNCERTFKHDYSVKAHEEACLFLSRQQGELGESRGPPATGQTDPGPSGSTHQQSMTCEAGIIQLSATLSKQNSAFTYMHSVEGSSARAKRSLERRTCKVCGKVVQRPAVLRKHMVTHTGDWPYRCPTCKKIYKTLRSFQEHIERCVFPIEETPEDSESSSSTNATKHPSSTPEPNTPIGSSKRCARCPICHKFISGYLRYHILSHSDERPHACPRCGSKYKFDFVLRRHMRLFCKVRKGEPVELGEKKIHKCNECGKEFGLKSTLTAHKRIHNPLRCAYCRRMFPDQETLAIHKVEHKPVQCTMCEKSFNVIRYLSRHYVDDHQFSGPFRCTYCERSYAELSVFVRHERTHTGDLPYKCSHCPKKFHFETALVTHQRTHTGEKPCLCWECGKSFQSKGILKTHMNRVHTPQVKRFPCSQCNKAFRDKGQMKMHENVYHKGVRYPCSYCGKGFYSPAPLARHVLIHTGENPYSCTYKECTRVFKSASELRIHMRYHTGDRPFKCKDCGKGFVQAHYLTIHRRSHTGEKPYSCLTCNKSFSTSHQLSRHMKTHTGEKPYQCTDCGKAFNRRDRLRTHQDKCHPAF